MNFINIDAKSADLPSIVSLSQECFRSGLTQACRRAIVATEKFQLHSGSKDRYSCQTRLLGLEANLIMRMNKGPRNKWSSKAINDVKNLCSGL